VIEFNFLSDPRDEIRLRQGVQMAASLYADSRLLDVNRSPFVLRRAARLQNYNKPDLAKRVQVLDSGRIAGGLFHPWAARC